MSDLWEFAVNSFHLRLVPTVKRMLNRRRMAYTLLTVGVLGISVLTLSLLLCHTAGVLSDYDGLSADYEAYLTHTPQGAGTGKLLTELREALMLAKNVEIALFLLCGGIWLILSIIAVGQIMKAVVESEAYVYGLYMIYGADRKQLSHQLSVEFCLAGIPALLLGLPGGFGLYRFFGGTGSFPVDRFWIAVPCFLLLILLCASVLSRRVLGRSCMKMLHMSDTSDITSSPRRSHLMGLTQKRNAFSAAWLAMWRMRRHYGALILAVLLVTAPVFAILTPMEVPTVSNIAFTLQFPKGTDRQNLISQYSDKLEVDPRIGTLSYTAADTAENLGIHILADPSQVGGEEGLPQGTRYATDSFRIACGDGDTFFELGGNLIIPEDRKHITPPDDLAFGYKLDAVPVGYAVYVYPADTTPPLSLQIGDTVKLFLPSSKGVTVPQGEHITVRISDVVAVPSLRGDRGGPEICPRITEDYLYLSPTEFEKFHGQPHAQAFVAEEADPSAFFPEEETDSCILVVSRGNAPFKEEPSHVTVIVPKEPIKEPFRDRQGKESLPDDTYFINRTAKGMGVYLGTEEAYALDAAASEALYKWQKTMLGEYVGSILPTMETQEYRVEQILYTEEGGPPYLILPHGENLHYSSMQNDLCAFRLKSVDQRVPLMTGVAEEAYLLETDILLGSSFFGRPCYIGTTLLPNFVAAMKVNHLNLQLPEQSFLHTKTLIKSSFTLGNRHYLLADNFPYETYWDIYQQGPSIQADRYPRVVTGVGSFCHVGSTKSISFLKVSSIEAMGLFDGESIGTLQNQSEEIPGQYAYNDWVVSPVEEVVPSYPLQSGHAVLFTNDPTECPLRAGDILSVSLWQDTAVFWSDPQYMSLQLRGTDPLPYLLDRISYGYVDIIIDDVRQGDETVLALTEADMGMLLENTALYRDLHIFLPETTDMEDYMGLYSVLTALTKTSGGQATLDYDVRYVIRQHTDSLANSGILKIIGALAICLIPLLLLSAQLVLFEKRAEEFSILYAIGIPLSTRRNQLAVETGLTACVTGICAALACPVGYLLLLILCDLVGAPLPVADFNSALCILLSVLTIVSAILAGLAAYLRVCQKHRISQQTRKEEPYEGSGM